MSRHLFFLLLRFVTSKLGKISPNLQKETVVMVKL